MAMSQSQGPRPSRSRGGGWWYPYPRAPSNGLRPVHNNYDAMQDAALVSVASYCEPAFTPHLNYMWEGEDGRGMADSVGKGLSQWWVLERSCLMLSPRARVR